MDRDIEVGTASTQGRPHRENQDARIVRPGLIAIADGIGGNPGGSVASQLAVEALAQQDELERSLGDPEGMLLLGFLRAYRWIEGRSEGELAWMGTTLTAVRLDGQRAVIAHVGDTRVYLLRAGRLRCLTEDHTVARAWRRASGDGLAPPPRAHATLTRALTAGRSPAPDLSHVRLEPGDTLLMTTDGVHDVLSAGELRAALGHRPRMAAEVLVARARAAGSRDDATAVVARLGGLMGRGG